MDIKYIKTGYLEENCYILSMGNDSLVIDPGDEADKIISEIGHKNVLGILITHYHFDHIGALEELEKKYNSVIIDYENRKEKIGDFKAACQVNVGCLL